MCEFEIYLLEHKAHIPASIFGYIRQKHINAEKPNKAPIKLITI